MRKNREIRDGKEVILSYEEIEHPITHKLIEMPIYYYEPNKAIIITEALLGTFASATGLAMICRLLIE